MRRLDEKESEQKESFFMSEIDRKEAQDMIEHALESQMPGAISKGLEDFLARYQLGPEQLVWLAQKHRIETAQNSLIRRLVISCVVSALLFLLGFGFSEWLANR